ncbi:MAG: hypothetical protein ACTSQ9_01800 [Candidatus Hodarchaeales archaeon]
MFSPANQSITNKNDVNWNDVMDASHYEVQVATNSAFSNVIREINVSTSD